MSRPNVVIEKQLLYKTAFGREIACRGSYKLLRSSRRHEIRLGLAGWICDGELYTSFAGGLRHV